MRLSRIQLLTLAAAAALYAYPVRSYDAFLHLHAGRYIWRTKTIPRTDPFSALPAARGRPWVNHSWLSALALYAADSAAGLAGLVWLRMLLMAGAAWTLMQACRQGGARDSFAAGLALLACAAARPFVLARPMLFTFLFSMLALQLARREPFRWREAWLFAALCAAWANLHAGVIVGFAVIAAHAAAQTLWGRRGAAGRMWAALGLAALASLLNPYGWRVPTYVFRLAGMAAVTKQIAEWSPLEWSPALAPAAAVAALWLAALAFALRGRPAPRRAAAAALAAAFGVAAFPAQRNVVLFALFAAAAVGDAFGQALARRPKSLACAGWCAAALAAAACLFADRHAFGFGAAPGRFPAAGLDALIRRGFHGGVLSEYRWGGYILWRGGEVRPPLRPVQDGRLEVYGADLFRQIADVLALKPGWEDALRRWGVNLIVFDRAKTGPALRRTGRWRLIWFDDVCVVWARPTPETAAAVAAADRTLLDPSDIALRIRRGDRLDAIERGYLAALAENPRSWFVLQTLGQCAIRRNDYARGRDLFRLACALAPANADARYHWAYCLSKLGRWRDALARYRGAIRLRPGESVFRLGAGQCLAALGRYDAAEREFRASARLDPAFVPPREQLAELFARRGRWPEARREIEAVARLAGPAAGRRLAARLARIAAATEGGKP